MTNTLDGMTVQQLDELIQRATATKKAVVEAEANNPAFLLGPGEVKTVDGVIYGFARAEGRSAMAYRKRPGNPLDYEINPRMQGAKFDVRAFSRDGNVKASYAGVNGGTGDSAVNYPQSIAVIAHMFLLEQEEK